MFSFFKTPRFKDFAIRYNDFAIRLYISYFILICCSYLTTAIHEIGHFIAGLICGIKPIFFEVGQWFIVFEKIINNIIFKLRILPFGGANAWLITDLESLSSSQRIFIFSAGPFIDLIFLIILLFVAYKKTILRNFFQSLLGYFGLLNRTIAILIVIYLFNLENIIPRQNTLFLINNVEMFNGNDGFQILRELNCTSPYMKKNIVKTKAETSNESK